MEQFLQVFDTVGTTWYADAAPVPNLSPATLSRLTRRDVVFNSNESSWLPHPSVTLEGFSPLHGEVRTPRSLRTRMNARLLSEVREGGASGADGRFTLEEVQAAALSNRSLTTELLREEVVRRCQATPRGTAQGQSVDLTEACAGLPATRPLGEVQFAPRAGQRVPVHGGLGQDGVTNVVNYNLNLLSSLEPPTPRGTVLNPRTGLTADGYVIMTSHTSPGAPGLLGTRGETRISRS